MSDGPGLPSPRSTTRRRDIPPGTVRMPEAFAGMPVARPRRRPKPMTTEQLDALCGGPPSVMVGCPRDRCRRKLGPYYSADSPDARAAVANHMLMAHQAVWAGGAGTDGAA